jgi:hypothetical protein
MDRSANFHSDDKPSSLATPRGEGLKKRAERLASKLAAALDNDNPFDLGNYLHTETTEALRMLAFSADPGVGRKMTQLCRSSGGGEEDWRGRRLRVKFPDGSAGGRFPLRVLTEASRPHTFRSDLALRLGTLTLRHREYEDAVDLFLLRDRETRGLSNGEVEGLAFARMKQILDDSDLGDESYILMHQSGLEPLVVGACRAVVESMLTHPTRRLLMMRPIFSVQQDGTPIAGSDWTFEEAAL